MNSRRAALFGGMLIVMSLTGCRSGEVEASLPASSLDAIASPIRAAFHRSRASEVVVDLDAAQLTGEGKLLQALVEVGFAVRDRGRIAFTDAAIRDSVPCGSDAGKSCRSFVIAHMGLEKAISSKIGNDGFGRSYGIGIVFSDRSTPVGALGTAMARDGTLACADASGRVAWHGERTAARVAVLTGLTKPVDHMDDERSLLAALDVGTLTVLVHCPIEPKNVDDEESELRVRTNSS